MNTIPVHASQPYTVYIENGLLQQLKNYVPTVKAPCQVAIITDDRVSEYYLHTVTSQLTIAGYTVCQYLFPHGESSKNVEELINIVEFLAEKRFTRSDLIVALGGGVVGDMAGFAAATYLRGIDYIQIPTSLLAAVDSSVGGKTAVNLRHGKNLWGAFKQPIAVFCDPTTLRTLPEKEFINGCGEIIKYGMLGYPQLLNALEKEPLTPSSTMLNDIIAQCVEAKALIVKQDERESGVRQLLNFGHTFAHGIELASHYTVSHGYAVAIGMMLMTHGAVAVDGLDRAIADRLHRLIVSHQLPTTTTIDTSTLLELAKNDKKSRGQTINIIIPTDWGHSRIKQVTHEELRHYLEPTKPTHV